MLPVILGVAAAAIFLSGCGRSEESPPPPSAPPSYLPPPASAPRLRPLGSASSGRWLVPTLIPHRSAGPLPFSAPQCPPGAERPERFVIQDARQEYCRLHEILRGGSCRIEGNRVIASDAPTTTSIFSLIPNLQNEGNFSSVMANPELRTKLSTLEGLQMYLYSGTPCSFENLQDLMDMMGAYTLYRSVLTSPRADLRQAFADGRVGCILRRGIHEESGGHDHAVNGSVVHHQVSRHDLLVTPATIQLEGLPADTPVSDCLVVR